MLETSLPITRSEKRRLFGLQAAPSSGRRGEAGVRPGATGHRRVGLPLKERPGLRTGVLMRRTLSNSLHGRPRPFPWKAHDATCKM